MPSPCAVKCNGQFVTSRFLTLAEMTKEEFIEGYCNRSKVTWEWLSQFQNAIPCDCGEDGCNGWQMVHKDNLENGK